MRALRFDETLRGSVEVGSYDDVSTARIAPFEAIELEVGRLFPPAAR